MDSESPNRLKLPTNTTLGRLSEAALQCGRLSQMLSNNPLLPSILFRARLQAARNAAAADGHAIDPWHLAALLAGLRVSLAPDVSIAERGHVFQSARHAMEVHQWLAMPDERQEDEITSALQAISAENGHDGPFMAAGRAMHGWLSAGRARSPMRTAIIRHWQLSSVFIEPLPVIAARSTTAGNPSNFDEWLPIFLHAVAAEAADISDLTRHLDRAWRTARHSTQGRRRTSRASDAVDVLATMPLTSPLRLAAILNIAPKNALRLLEQLCEAGGAVEVSRRAKRRLYALAGMEALKEAAAAPRRPTPNRGRGRPRAYEEDILPPDIPVEPSTHNPLPPLKWDYDKFDRAMVELGAAISETRRRLIEISKKPL